MQVAGPLVKTLDLSENWCRSYEGLSQALLGLTKLTTLRLEQFQGLTGQGLSKIVNACSHTLTTFDLTCSEVSGELGGIQPKAIERLYLAYCRSDGNLFGLPALPVESLQELDISGGTQPFRRAGEGLSLSNIVSIKVRICHMHLVFKLKGIT